MGLTTAGKTALLTWAFTTDAITRPASWEVSMHTESPGAAGTANEVSTGVDADYVRHAVTFGSEAGGVTLSDLAVSHTADAVATTYTVKYIVIWDVTNADPLVTLELVVPITFTAGATKTFNIGDIAITAA